MINFNDFENLNIQGITCLSWASINHSLSYYEKIGKNIDNINNKSNNKSFYRNPQFVVGSLSGNIAMVTMEVINKCPIELKKTIKQYNIKKKLFPKFHTGWINSIDWMKSMYNKEDIVCSAGEDRNIFIWKIDQIDNDNFKPILLIENSQFPFWKCSFNEINSELAFVDGNNTIYIFKENDKGNWEKKHVEEDQLNEDNINEKEIEI